MYYLCMCTYSHTCDLSFQQVYLDLLVFVKQNKIPMYAPSSLFFLENVKLIAIRACTPGQSYEKYVPSFLRYDITLECNKRMPISNG